MAFNGKALVEAAKENLGLLQVAGVGVLVGIILMVVADLIANNITGVSSATNTTIQGFLTQLGTVGTSIIGVFGTLAGFVLVVAIMRAFGVEISLGKRV